jgi:hypothetical protein
LTPTSRASAYQTLDDLNLRHLIFRFLELPAGEGRIEKSASIFAALAPQEPISFGLALAAASVDHYLWQEPPNADIRRLFEKPVAQKVVRALRQSLKISNDESEDLEGTLTGLDPLLGERQPSVAIMKRFLALPTGSSSRLLLKTAESLRLLDPAVAGPLQARLAELEQTDFAPTPFITGIDLTGAGLTPGPLFKRILDTVYDAQLESRISTREEAMELAMKTAR